MLYDQDLWIMLKGMKITWKKVPILSHNSSLYFQLTTSLRELCSWLRDMTNPPSPGQKMDQSSSQVSACAKLLLHCQPLLSVYCEVVENHVAKSLALHRTLGKMLSVMLAVFTQLALKVRRAPQPRQFSSVVEHQTRDCKVTGSIPGRSGGRTFFSRVGFLF